MTTVSVIIASYRPHERLLECLQSLKRQEPPPDNVIVAVDTHEQVEGLLAWLVEGYIAGVTDFLFPAVLSSGKTGAAAARNAAAAVAGGDILAFIDDDAVASPGWIQSIHDAFKTPATLVTGGPVWPRYDPGCRCLPSCWWWIIGCTSVIPPTMRPISCNMAIRRSTFEEMGGFNADLGRVGTTLSIGEETDLILRIQEKYPLYAVRYDPASPPVYHHIPRARTSWRYILTRAYHEGRGKAILRRVHPLTTESGYLGHMIRHPDRYTVPVLAAVAAGYGLGRLS
jgi:GT2 family glycosyltransferase